MSSDWEPTTLGSVCDRQGGSIQTGPFGSQLHASDYVEQGIPVVMPANIGSDGGISEDGIARITQFDADRLQQHKLQVGDVVFSRRGDVTRNALIEAHQAGWLCGTGCLKVRLGSQTQASAKFISYCLRLPETKDWLVRHAVGATMPNLNTSILSAVPILLPELPVQQSIANILGCLDERIDLLRETNATLEAIVQALFKSWFVDFDPVHARARGEQPAGLAPEVAALFPDSFEESALGMVPKGWNTGTLGDVAHFQNGYAFKSKDWCESGHPVVKIGDVKPGIIDFSGCSYIAPETTEGLSRFKLRRGDLLVGMTGYVGETGLVPHVEPHAYLNQRVGRIATKSGLIDLGFVYCLVRNSAFKGYAEARSHGSAQANVSGAVLLDYPVVTPTQNILDRFNGSVGVLLERILSNHEQAQTLATLRDTLLPRLISGQLRLPEAEAMVEGAS
ncbi:restriction endonuclease subunit S [Aeromonas allosaccharophila]|nr:restriction endonuclease subunit S [Aeromonas veronii]